MLLRSGSCAIVAGAAMDGVGRDLLKAPAVTNSGFRTTSWPVAMFRRHRQGATATIAAIEGPLTCAPFTIGFPEGFCRDHGHPGAGMAVVVCA